ncbi:unnamed protein product [Rhizoctonia solani]|uniref:Mitochondrial Rho GTPase n=1 Tax=Rhizoctonia solani TaxID=456999 RepID=A0A8H3GXX1_9AGAM|nr:unnamed protein product [Rhizoctonia solani]CAE6523508.1 unnamed protein product [Rhizoctonia solani]
MRRDVRVLLVGDDSVGKSTIVTSLIKEEYVDNVQHVVPEVTIPPEVTPENVTTYIVDSSAAPADRPHLESEIRKAHVICVVYAIDNPNSFDRVPTYWLPYFRSLGVNVPVILVGNKIDLRGGEVSNEDLENEVAPIMEEFKACRFCHSAIDNLIPSTLKPAAVDALRRIFRLCDINKDGVLDTHELNEFQQTCFKAPLQPQEVEGIKFILRSHDPSMLRPIPSSALSSPNASPPASPSTEEEGVTEDGFLYLHTEFIRRARVETTWVVLRQFGYAEDLRLTEGWLSPKFDVPHDCSVELSPQGYQFFTDIFQIFDKASDQDGALRPEELENLFNTSPGNPWAAEDDEGVDGTITLQHWLAKWSMTTLLDHKKTLAYLAYLGYNTGPTTGALKITKPRRPERRKDRVTRNVFLCYVVGGAGSGKTSILNTFRQLAGGGVETSISKDASKSKGKGVGELGPYTPTEKVLSVVGAVELRGAEKYLVMQEFGSKSEANMLRDVKTMDLADVIIYVHDSSDTNSFSYISGLRRHEVQPDVYCRRLGLQGPYAVSIKNPQIANLFPEIVATAINPLHAIPGGAERASATLARRKIVLSVGVAIAGIMVAYRSFLRPIGYGNGWWSSWVSWIMGGAMRRDS